MNDILIYGQNYGALTNRIEANMHRHWMLQLFISTDTEFSILVESQVINCSAIVINANTAHEFNSGNSIYFTMLVDPTTQLGRVIRACLQNNNLYYIFPEASAIKFQKQLANILSNSVSRSYSMLIKNIVSFFDDFTPRSYDQRIEWLIKNISSCECEQKFHIVKFIAKEMSISESRLSHLFKEETGIPLKSYIVLHKVQSVYKMLSLGENITHSAMSSGFDSPSHFAFVNRKMTGMSTRDIIEDSRFLKVIL